MDMKNRMTNQLAVSQPRFCGELQAHICRATKGELLVLCARIGYNP
jgi:hypothetical protein